MTCRRLTIFGSSNIVNNLDETKIESDLGIPVRLIPASSCKVVREKIGLIDPALDRFILLHGLCDEPHDIASESSKSDVDKGADSDQAYFLKFKLSL
jgi:hypothetical protein